MDTDTPNNECTTAESHPILPVHSTTQVTDTIRTLRKRSNISYSTTTTFIKKMKPSSSSSSQGILDIQKTHDEQQQQEEQGEEGVLLRISKNHHPSSSSSSPNLLDHDTEKARHLITSWICAECKEAECMINTESPLLVCEGPCLRLFHFPCARLSSIPPSQEPWMCHDCIQQRHKCCACQEYGIDNQQVYKCEKKTCGLFYHEQCLAMYDPLVTIHHRSSSSSSSSSTVATATHTGDETLQQQQQHNNNNNSKSDSIQNHNTNSNNQPTSMRLKFKCPAHQCWTCSGGIPDKILVKNHQDNSSSSILDESSSSLFKSNKTVSSSLKNKLKACFHEKTGDLIVRYFIFFIFLFIYIFYVPNIYIFTLSPLSLFSNQCITRDVWNVPIPFILHVLLHNVHFMNLHSYVMNMLIQINFHI